MKITINGTIENNIKIKLSIQYYICFNLIKIENFILKI
jgi:hypothetical protein